MDKNKKQKVSNSDRDYNSFELSSSECETPSKTSNLQAVKAITLRPGQPRQIQEKPLGKRIIRMDTPNSQGRTSSLPYKIISRSEPVVVNQKRKVPSDESGEEDENLGEDDADVAPDVFSPEKEKNVPPESSKETVTSEEIKWYPYKDTDTAEGKITKLYLRALSDAAFNEVEVFRFLSVAEANHKNISCEKTIRVWKRLSTVITTCSRLELNEVACDIASYLRYNPESLSPYLKCFGRVMPHIKPTSDTPTNIEGKQITVISTLEILLKIKSLQDETLKYIKEQKQDSPSLVTLHKMMESIQAKQTFMISKLDLTFSRLPGPSQQLTIPTVSSLGVTVPRTIQVKRPT
ncbi:PREDICTED: uncharacterized protein LOC105451723 [Wasmannia auropunctata]|uniref:uncharacterized protein LOC105451723 n=1 Tax=Wasmannia auropunctata TaxID=64793 RepID=UPI0005EFDB18|nr:PREDICTED: uncharacterized protein LOC105451723 [Wasmannia auropunctata]